MKTKILRMARRLWNVPGCPRELNRANARKWVRSLRQLGDNWVLAKYEGRKA